MRWQKKWQSPSVQTHVTSFCLTGSKATANFLNWKHFAKSTSLNYTSCALSSHLWHTQSQSVGNCCFFLSNALPGTWGGLSASQSRYRTSSATCYFPRFLKLQGIPVSLPRIQVRHSQLNFSHLRWIWDYSWDYLNTLQLDKSSKGLKDGFGRIWLAVIAIPYSL